MSSPATTQSTADRAAVAAPQGEGGLELVSTPLLPDGFEVPASRWTRPSTRMRQLLESEPYLFGPGVYDAMGGQLAMYYGFKAVYFSGYSFAIGHLGTTDMDLYQRRDRAQSARCASSSSRWPSATPRRAWRRVISRSRR
jgi:hypothetical protein